RRGVRANGAAFPGLFAELRPGAPAGLRAFLRESGLPPVATGGVHFLDRAGWARHHLLRAIALNTTLDRVPVEELGPRPAFLATPEEMERRFPDLPEALDNAARIAEACSFAPEMGRPLFPVYEMEDGRKLEGQSLGDYLEQECREGILRRYGRMTEAA